MDQKRKGGPRECLLCATPSFQGFDFFCLFGILFLQVGETLFVETFGFKEFGSLRLEGFHAGGEVVDDVGVLVGACHCAIAWRRRPEI